MNSRLVKFASNFTINFLLCIFSITSWSSNAQKYPNHFDHIMIVMFENMSYAEVKAEPTFSRLVEYTGHQLDESGRLLRLRGLNATADNNGIGYAFFSQYYNNHSGGDEPTRPSQPNYIAMVSGSIHNVTDDENHDIDADNLARSLTDAKLDWKVYAENLPDPAQDETLYQKLSALPAYFYSLITPYQLNPALSEDENDQFSHAYYKQEAERLGFHLSQTDKSACFTDKYYGGNDGYWRKHEPMISFKNIQNETSCKNIINSSHLTADLDHMPAVSLYIPNQLNDGHNGALKDRVVNANRFLSSMLGTDPKTGEPLPDAAKAPFQRFMAKGGLLVITFDEPSVTGNPDKTIYTLFAGKMINSGAYPDQSGQQAPICYPDIARQTSYPKDKNGAYKPGNCNHYNLLKLIEANWGLRELASKDTSSGYKYAYPIDYGLASLWKI